MTYCHRCKGMIGDIGDPHRCADSGYIAPVRFNPPSIPLSNGRIGLKCDICGSTAIDHTETQCNINRQLKRNKEGKHE